MVAKISKEFVRRFSSNPFLYSFGILIFLYLIYDQYIKSTSGQHLIPFSVLAIIAGVIYESKRITSKWHVIIIIGIISFFVTYAITNFIVRVNFENPTGYNSITNLSIRRWPLIFLIIYFLFSLFFYKDRIIPKLTEGITLLQSLAIVYWVIDYGFITSENPFMLGLIGIGLLFSLFTIFHAFTHTPLSNTHKLILSIWSSVIMMLFAIDNISAIYENEPIEDMTSILKSVYIAIAYFLLGISSIYIIQNFLLLYRFLPRRKRFFNSRYFNELKALKSDHINRYSHEQISRIDALVCIIFIGAIFYGNYYFQIVPRQFAIWLTFVIFPFMVMTYKYFFSRKKNIF